MASLEEQLGMSAPRAPTQRGSSRAGMSLEEQLETPEVIRLEDLTKDEHFSAISAYMEDKTGLTYSAGDMTVRSHSREEIVEAYIESMRNFNAGNSVSVGMELDHLNRGEGEELTRRRSNASRAYSTWDSVENAFAEGTSAGTRAGAVKDYAQAIIMDPVNVVTLGIGRLATQGVTRASTIALKELAKQSVKATLKQQAARGVRGAALKAAGRAAGDQAMARGLREFGSAEAIAIGRRSAVRKATVAEILTVGAADAAIAVGVDAGMQKVDEKTGRSEGYDATRGAIAAATGVIGAGLVGGVQLARGTSGLAKTSKRMVESNETMAAAAKRLSNVSAAVKEVDGERGVAALGEYAGNMKELVARGELLKMERGTAWDTYKAQTHLKWINTVKATLQDSGLPIRVIDQATGDRRSAWLANLIDHPDFPQGLRIKLQEFTDATIGVTEGKKGLSLREATALNAAQTSQAAQLMVAQRTTANLLPNGKAKPDPMGMTNQEAVEHAMNEVGGEETKKTIGEFLASAQHNFIRMLVTNPATTALNVVGWSQATAMQSSADVIRGTLYGGTAMLKGLTGDITGSAKYFNKAKLMYQLQGRKFRNLVDFDGTKDEVLDYLTYRPESQKALFRYLIGGTDSEDILKELQLSPGQTLDQNKSQKAFRMLQSAYGVNLQDMLTKTQEFAYNLDKQIRIKYGMTMSEFMDQKDIADILTNPKRVGFEDYLKIEATAVEDTLRNVYSKKMGKHSYDEGFTQLSRVANVIEEARNIPVIGALVPFGQFFNNTISFMYDYSGVNLMTSLMTGRMGKNATRDPMEIMTRAAAGWTAIGWAVYDDMENLEEGLAWHEERKADGTVVTRLYDYPVSFWKMAGRIGSHIQRDGAVPIELTNDFLAKFGGGDLVKNLKDTAGDVYGAIEAMATGNSAPGMEVVQAGLGKAVSMYASGVTRFADPVNIAMSFAEGEDYVEPTRAIGNKHMNNAIRYTDRIFDSLIGLENMPWDTEGYSVEKNSATTDRDVGTNVSRVAGIRRISPASSIQKLYNDVGRPDWKTNIDIGNETMENLFNEHVFPYLEASANEMIDSGKWDNLSLAMKQEHLTQMLRLSRDEVLDIMSNTSSGTDTGKIALIKDITGQRSGNVRVYRDILERFDVDEAELDGLEGPQLELILWFLQEAQKNRRDTRTSNIENPWD